MQPVRRNTEKHPGHYAGDLIAARGDKEKEAVVIATFPEYLKPAIRSCYSRELLRLKKEWAVERRRPSLSGY